MIGRARIIENDLFGIAGRLKAIDPSYFVAYNYELKRFEIHSKSQRGGSLCLVVPYNRLDERTVRLALKTRAERRERLFAEMERENALLEAKETERILKKTEKEVERAYGKL